jgi:hypothetical protein
MRLPLTSAANTFRIAPSRKTILFNSGAFLTTATSSTLQVLSVINEATQTAVIQNTAAAQPTWSSTAMVGATFTYAGSPAGTVQVLAQQPGGPGVNSSNVPASPAFVFNGTSQYFEYDALAGQYPNDAPVTVVATFNTSAAVGTILGFGTTNTGHLLQLVVTSSTSVAFQEINVGGTFAATASGLSENTTYVVTGIRANGFLTIRVNGTQATAVAMTPTGSDTYTTFTIGALNSNVASGTPTGSNFSGTYFTGQIGEVLVYSGNADVYGVEDELLLKYGVILGNSSGKQSGGW